MLPIMPIFFNFFDMSITNQSLILFFMFLGMSLLAFLIKSTNKTFFMVPTDFQFFLELIYQLMTSLVQDNMHFQKKDQYFPMIFSMFFFVSLLNTMGLIPYSFTVTSHMIVTFALSLAMFIAINIMGMKKHGWQFFSVFLPSGTSFMLALLLVPIEFMSYMFKPISLSIRLFANMMAGHTLLKVIAFFAIKLLSLTGTLFLFSFVPLLMLIPIFMLEFCVALIQAYVYSILMCIYMNDAMNLH